MGAVVAFDSEVRGILGPRRELDAEEEGKLSSEAMGGVVELVDGCVPAMKGEGVAEEGGEGVECKEDWSLILWSS